MKRNIALLSTTLFLALALTACGTSESINTKDATDTPVTSSKNTDSGSATQLTLAERDIDKELEEAVYENTMDMQEENVDDYMEDLALSEEDMEFNKQLLQEMFRLFDLKYEMSNFKIIEKTEDTALVEVVSTATQVGGEDPYPNNSSTLQHEMKYVDGKWLFTNSVSKSVEYHQTNQ